MVVKDIKYQNNKTHKAANNSVNNTTANIDIYIKTYHV